MDNFFIMNFMIVNYSKEPTGKLHSLQLESYNAWTSLPKIGQKLEIWNNQVNMGLNAISYKELF